MMSNKEQEQKDETPEELKIFWALIAEIALAQLERETVVQSEKAA